MGMFDTIRFDAPLPGIPLPEGVEPEFQTKDLDCYLENYTVNVDGFLIGPHREFLYWTGTMEFYTCNTAAADGKGNVFTRNGEDNFWAEYKAEFRFGTLQSVEQIRFETKKARPMGEFPL